ncbi:MAG TPA: protein kinase [Thermoanaerobaculia bacterium]|jgi:Tol biopolymer transport system component
MTASGDFVGTEIGRYRIVSTLGRGGMGEVYDAIDSSLGRHVALKILSADAVADARRVARFIQEARAASSLNHPHVVSIHEIGEDRGVRFIAMERVEGSTLRGIFSSGRLPVSRSLEILAQVADAVAAAHVAGIVHRDLKPENIMVSRDGYAKVLDFGLAKLQPDAILKEPDGTTMMRLTDSGTVLGTVGYMSPEQVQGKEADGRSDIFSLGCILYEAIAGRRAFHAATSIDTLHKIVHEEPQPLREIAPEVSPELLRIVRKMMAKDPDERYHSAKDLALDLRMLVREGSAPAAVRTSDRPRWKMSPLAGIAIAAVLLGMAAAGVLFWRRSASPQPPTVTAFQRITAKGSLITTRVSPDGRFLVYAQNDDGPTVSIWIRQLATGEDLQIVPRLSGSILGCTFTPDNSAIVYAIRGENEPRGAFYRVATIGGVPQRVGTGTDSAPAFSPDGKQMAWLLDAHPKPDQSALMIGNSDGSAARVLAVRRFPEIFAPISFARPAWSPDGRTIAASVKRLLSPDSAAVIGFDPESGSERSLSDAPWVSVSAIEWLPDQSGIVAIAAADAASVHATTKTGSQIWLIPQPSGSPRRITNDTLYYREVSVTSDGKNLVADLADATVHLWRKTIDEGEPARRISTGRFDGVAGVSILPDGRVVFTSTERGTTTLWLMNADGSGRKQLLRNPYREEYPMAFAGGIVYVATTPAATELCVTNDDGESRRVVASPIDDSPVAASPDGRSFVYAVHDRLWQVSADGQQRVQLTRTPALSPVYSPEGDRVAFIGIEPGGKHLVVLDARTSTVSWRSGPLPASSNPRWLRWAHDGKGLLLSSWGPVWLFPFEGEPRVAADFGDTTWSFDVSPDRVFFVSRGTVTRDAVLITNFR